MKKSVFFIGTIAELIKVFPLMIQMKEESVPFEIISTGQNDLLDDSIIKHFWLPEPVIVIRKATKNQTPKWLLIWFFWLSFMAFFKCLFYVVKNRPYFWIIHGDTLSTALWAFLWKIFLRKIVHIEAGCRSGNLWRPFPEEIDRIIADFFSDIYATPDKNAYNFLKGRRGVIIDCGYNTAVDALYYAEKNIDWLTFPFSSLIGKKYFAWVMHRPENVADGEYVRNMVDIISTILETYTDLHCIFYLHSNTKSGLEAFWLLEKIQSLERLTMTPRISFLPNVYVLKNSEFIISDGWWNQQEAAFMGKPCITARKETETPDGIGKNGILSIDKQEILGFVKDYTNYIREPLYPEKLPTTLILEHLMSYDVK